MAGAAVEEEQEEADIYYADDSYTSKGPVTEEEFFAAWQAKKVHGWPDSALVWWTELEGAWVPLNGDTARKRFGTRFAATPAKQSRKDELDAGPAPKRLKDGAATKDSDCPSGHVTAVRPVDSRVIDLSEDSGREVVVPGRQQTGLSQQTVATTPCIDLASDDEDDASIPPQPTVNRSRDTRAQHGREAQPTEQGATQQPRARSTGSGWSGSPSNSSAQPMDRERAVPRTDIVAPAAASSAPSNSNGSLWSRQCKVNRIAPEMVPITWTEGDDPPQELVDWLKKLLKRAGDIVEVTELRKDRSRGGLKYSCKLTMITKKAMLTAISLSNLPDQCEAHGKQSSSFLHISNVPRYSAPSGAPRGGDSTSSGGSMGDYMNGGGYTNGGGLYNAGCSSGWGGGFGAEQITNRPGWAGGGHDGSSDRSTGGAGGGYGGGYGGVSSGWGGDGSSYDARQPHSTRQGGNPHGWAGGGHDGSSDRSAGGAGGGYGGGMHAHGHDYHREVRSHTLSDDPYTMC